MSFIDLNALWFGTRSLQGPRSILAALIVAVVAGCALDTPTTPISPSSQDKGLPASRVAPSSLDEVSTLLIMPPSDQIEPLGILDLDGYCRNGGYANSTLTQPRLGPNAAFNNWRCQTSAGDVHPFSMTQACQWQYQKNGVQAHPTDPDDAYTWVCYVTPGGQK